MTYDVHVYATVRIKVWNVEADGHDAAIQKADQAIDFYGLFPDPSSRARPAGEAVVQVAGWAEDVEGCLVDDAGDSRF